MSVCTLSSLLPTVREAGRAAMAIYERGCDVRHKADDTPVTEADLAVDRILVPAIEAAFPATPVVSEERAGSFDRATGAARFVLVDPIDGTKEFIKRTGEFTINVALIAGGAPVAGIVYAPAAGRMFIGDASGFAHEHCDKGARTALSVRDCADRDLVAVASRSHLTEATRGFLRDHAIDDCVNAGSSLKFCLLAAGEADIYPRFGPTMEWDTAAGDAVLRAAGGMVLTADGKPLAYGKPGFANPDFIACSPGARRRCRLGGDDRAVSAA
ncbi:MULTISPECIES: 3'(2'),5'-bisphosphate nucleotidase CysQ [unclassified Roseitalea]|uniref:3'(2'),5'-bisphosphate nucleotidase CysQ n=1 Tax=unclassified Roseitalea TaxID=2639107 RepID=UPI00273D06AD|nr:MULTISPECIES: 3'(2'),5'-bisphosphate nucleotidase CysQ [unclassified Roseitalea]